MTDKPDNAAYAAEPGPIALGEQGVPAAEGAHTERDADSAAGSVLVEVICERFHCVMYDYAITTVELVAEEFEEAVRVMPVVRRGTRENAERFLELCRLNGRHLSVPTILIDGQVVFTDVPTPAELRQAIEQALSSRQST